MLVAYNLNAKKSKFIAKKLFLGVTLCNLSETLRNNSFTNSIKHSPHYHQNLQHLPVLFLSLCFVFAHSQKELQ